MYLLKNLLRQLNKYIIKINNIYDFKFLFQIFNLKIIYKLSKFVILISLIFIIVFLDIASSLKELKLDLSPKKVEAATSGITKFYLHKESSPLGYSRNALTLTPPEDSVDTASTSVSTQNWTSGVGCESSDNTGETFNKVSASAATTGNRCMATFMSEPLGQTWTITNADTTAIAANIWSSESSTKVAAVPTIYIYQGSGSLLTLIKTFTGTEPGTSPTQSNFAASAIDIPNVTFAATDFIVVTITMNVTTLNSNSSVSIYFDSTARAASFVSFKYTVITPNKPSLTGLMDDDFALDKASTTCSTTGVTYNTKWSCLNGSATNTTGAFNSEDNNNSLISGDSSEWLSLKNQFTGTGTASNFGATPSNTYIYQSLQSGYGDGNVRTIVNSTLEYNIGSSTPLSPYTHTGLVLWTSNTDYIEIQVYGTGNKSTTSDTAFVALNTNGSLSGATSLNSNFISPSNYNLIWLGFNKSGTNYQAQYSLDGTTWNNIGTAVSHSTAFTRVGLNVFVGTGAVANTYSGSFEWFQSTFTIPTPTFDQSGFKLYKNIQSYDPNAIISNPNVNTSPEKISATAKDTNYMYLAGEDVTTGNAEWRIEKRLLSTGALETTTFGSGIGIVTSNPSGGDDTVHAIAIDSTYMYIVGYNSNNSSQGSWRIEKRLLSTGALETTTFGSGTGIITSDPSSLGDDTPMSIAIDSTYMYIAGYDSVNSIEWRVEKRLLSTGALETTTFGSGTGFITSNPTTSSDAISSIAIDSTYMYLAGDYSTGTGTFGWRLEKRRLDTGALETTTFGSGTGSITSVSGSGNHINNIKIDSTYMYIGGSESHVDNTISNTQWRLEKRRLDTGALETTTFGSGTGIVTSNPSLTSSDSISSLDLDSSYIYLAGFDSSPGNNEWRVEKRLLSTGALETTTFGSGTGIVTSNPSDYDDEINSIIVDSSYIYIGGYYKPPGDDIWRLEKRDINSGKYYTYLSDTNNPATLNTTGVDFRIRITIHMGSYNLNTSGQSFKLQYAGKGAGTCASPSGTPNTYTDISTSTALSYKDTPNLSTNSNIYLSGNDPSHSTDTIIPQTYVEANNFTNSQNVINSGQDGMWDFSLFDNNATQNTTYCIRIAKSDGTSLDTYSQYPEITTAQSYFVQSKSQAFINVTTGGTVNLAFNNSVSSGNLIVVAIESWTGTTGQVINSVTDNKSNSYSKILQLPSTPASGEQVLSIWYAYNVTGGSTFTITTGMTSQGNISLAIHEYTGVLSSDPKDKFSSNRIVASTTTGDSNSTTTTSQSDEIVFGAHSHNSGSNVNATAGSTFTQRSAITDNSNSEALFTQDKKVSTTGTYNSTITFASSVTNPDSAVVTFKIATASLSTDIVDGSGNSVSSPSASMNNFPLSFNCSSTTGILGTSTQKLRVNNSTANKLWTLTIAANSSTSLWSSGSNNLDYNDPSASGCNDGSDADSNGGQLTINPSTASITPQGGCSSTGITLGSASLFSETAPIINSITLASSGSTAATNCFWDITGINLSQTIPAEQPIGNYSINLTVTIVSN